jgi:hypothetical protein
MAYFSQSDIQEYTGFASTDFKNAGTTMTATQWATLCTNIVDYVTHLVDRYCGVESFESHAVTEYHDGLGASGDDDTYLEYDVRFYLWEPAISVGTVSVDINADTSTKYWETRDERSTATAGDYMVATRGETTWIRFHQNCPQEGYHNVKIEYTAGYAAGSRQLGLIKWICLRIAKNMLLEMKKTQEVSTIRQTGVRDFSQMFEPRAESNILTDDIIRDLWKFRRLRLGGPTWD